jgi:acyl-CoA thioester hydrolase
MTKPPPGTRADYRHFQSVQTRWSDNDLYGHVNNVVYYSYFDTVINRFLIEQGGLDIHAAPTIGITAESGCRFLESFAYPETIDAGLRVGHLGNSSVRYEIGLFRQGAESAAAEGYFVHVFVERATQRPVPIPDPIRSAFESIKR